MPSALVHPASLCRLFPSQMKHIPQSLPSIVKPLMGLVLVAGAALPSLAVVKERPDQVIYLDRNGNTRTASGMVSEDTIDGVAVESRSTAIDAAKVVRVVFGQVPSAFRDGQSYAARNDFENALKQFRMAADDSEARQVVRAAARLEAGKMLLRSARFGGPESVFAEAVTEFDRFIGDYPTSRLLPEARILGARARRLAGDTQAAAELGAAVFDQMATSEDDAYTPMMCFDAGIAAAEAYYAAGDKASGDALLERMTSAITPMIGAAELAERDLLRAKSDEITLTSGFGMLAEGRQAQAVTFFEGKLRGDMSDDARFHARLGLAQGLLGQEKYREAQIQFATVSALTPTNRDDVGAALMGLVECTQNLNDSDSTERIRGWVTTCIEQYGDTPAAREARALAADL